MNKLTLIFFEIFDDFLHIIIIYIPTVLFYQSKIGFHGDKHILVQMLNKILKKSNLIIIPNPTHHDLPNLLNV